MAEVIDPLEALANSHLKRLQEIADEGFDKAKEACNTAISRLKRDVGLRDAVVTQSLAALGIEEKPTE